MKIAVIGSGNVGSTLGRRFAQSGHDVIFGSREPQSEKVKALLQSIGRKACSDSAAEAAKAADLVVLATPWGAAQETVRGIAGNLGGKVLVDATNAVAAGPTLALGQNTSAGEQVAGWAPGARVVKAFNTFGVEVMENSTFGGEKASLFIAGDDAEAKHLVARLGEELGFEPIDCGALVVARYLEAMTMIWVRFARMEGMGPGIAFKLLRR